MEKIREDVEEWFEAQCVEREEEETIVVSNSHSHDVVRDSGSVWSKPPLNWFKCNIGSSWSKRNQSGGGAWVLRDDGGRVLLHSRRAFASISSKEDALLRCLLWAMESMASHKVDKVIFAFQDKALVGAVMRPRAWPSFRAQSVALKSSLNQFMEWKVEVELAAANRGANLIARSVTRDLRSQSYVATGHPIWLARIFREEIGFSAV